MRAAIDSSGRIVVPKALRDALGLTPGQTLEIVSRGGHLELVPAATPMRLADLGEGIVAVPETDLPPLTVEQVRDTLDQVRR